MESESGIAQKLIGMFANEDTLELKNDCIEALGNLYFSASQRGLIHGLPQLEVVKAEDRRRIENLG